MKVTLLNEIERRQRNVAVGEFDGVHLGHRKVIGDSDTVLTFEPHPRQIVAPAAAPKLITPLAIKSDLIAELGVRELVVIPFDQQFAQVTAQAFIDNVLIGRLAVQQLSVGENFRFGNRAQGTIDLLKYQQGFKTAVVGLVEVDGEVVSSTHIRGLIAAGEIAQANEFLGSLYELRGTVARGDQRGRELGFPTANIVPDNALIYPSHGVYACLAAVSERPDLGWRAAAVSIGIRPTFVTGRGTLIEAYILDFSEDIYDRELRLRFVARLRGEKRFETAEALIKQMNGDIDATRAIVGFDTLTGQ